MGWKNSSLLGRLAVNKQRCVVVFNGGRIDHHFFDVAGVRQVKNGVNESLLHNGTQTARASFASQCFFGDGMQGFPKGAPYAGIISAAGGDDVPASWMAQLAEGGRLVAPTVTASGQQALVVIHKTSQGFERQILEAVHFVPLKSGIA